MIFINKSLLKRVATSNYSFKTLIKMVHLSDFKYRRQIIWKY
jgi:hypothetical protein